MVTLPKDSFKEISFPSGDLAEKSGAFLPISTELAAFTILSMLLAALVSNKLFSKLSKRFYFAAKSKRRLITA